MYDKYTLKAACKLSAYESRECRKREILHRNIIRKMKVDGSNEIDCEVHSSLRSAFYGYRTRGLRPASRRLGLLSAFFRGKTYRATERPSRKPLREWDLKALADIALQYYPQFCDGNSYLVLEAITQWVEEK